MSSPGEALPAEPKSPLLVPPNEGERVKYTRATREKAAPAIFLPRRPRAAFLEGDGGSDDDADAGGIGSKCRQPLLGIFVVLLFGANLVCYSTHFLT